MLTRLPNDTAFLPVPCGNNHTLAIDENYNLWGCGYNDFGCLGLKRQINYYNMVPIKLNFPVRYVNCGASYSFLIDDKGNLWASGNNNSGELSLEDTVEAKEFTKVKSETSFRSVHCGMHYTMVLDVDGNVWSTGDNQNGNLGLGDEKHRMFFTKTDNTKIQAISILDFLSLIFDENNDLWISGLDKLGSSIISPNGDKINKNYFVKTLNGVALLPDQILQKKYIKSAFS